MMKYEITYHEAGAELPQWEEEKRIPVAPTDPLPSVGDTMAIVDQCTGLIAVWRVACRHFTYLRAPEGVWSCTVILDVEPDAKRAGSVAHSGSVKA